MGRTGRDGQGMTDPRHTPDPDATSDSPVHNSPASGSGCVPVLHHGILILAGSDAAHPPRIEANDGITPRVSLSGLPGQWLIDPVPDGEEIRIRLPRTAEDNGPALTVRAGGWSGRVEWSLGGAVAGWARDLHAPARSLQVVAFDARGPVAFATTRAQDSGRFLIVLPAEATRHRPRRDLQIGICGSDFLLDGSPVRLPPPSPHMLQLTSRPLQDLGIRIKISTPNLKEAPLWGDWHFARSLAAGFERIGHQAGVDTADAWYAKGLREDVMLMIRGRHRITVDPARINIMWLISHPDRIPDEEFADFDHVAVASDIYAAILRGRGLPSVSVLHQAADAHLFQPPDPAVPRLPRPVFVGNSRREYRTMVKWCIQQDLPLDLYGGGWEGILPPEAVVAPSVTNADLGALYGRHVLLLNDHWDSMREGGFLSNRLFDGSATGTPILTDPVAGLADVFGDTIPVAGDAESFAAIVSDCLADPAPYLERAARAREIVLAAHTFDHRAAELSALIERIAARRAMIG